MDKISLSAERMSALIFDVLSYSKLASEEQYIPTDLNEVINTVLSDYDLAVSEKNAVIEKDILPIINAVPSQMHQLFSNLISNALKYSGADPFIEIKYATVISPVGLPQAEITIKDNGIGFDDQYSEQIFKLFQRLHGRSEYNGTGIGLSICKKIVDQHHGTISAKSNIGKGAAFTVLLPL
jgi:signal transduction histidine kinase